jgi:hypothetical protein
VNSIPINPKVRCPAKRKADPRQIVDISKHFSGTGRPVPCGVVRPIDGHFIGIDADGEVVGSFRSLITAVRAVLPHEESP